ncbi:MAG TPA: hypothetical protein VKQ05_12915 [Gemmatimonadales bacterium]|nr:hypothetical protein [Gemmatimonadales bacterium]
MTLSTVQARKMAKRLGQFRSKLTLSDIEEALPELNDPAAANAWLEKAYIWAASGKIPGTVANACVRAVEVWLKSYDLAKVTARIRELEQQLAEANRRRDA